MTVRESIDRAPMGRYQIAVVTACIALNMVDGFDILAMSFTAPGAAREWALTGSQIGVLLSAGLVGMALGSMCVAPFGDRIGRRPLTLACLAVAALGMAWSAWSAGPVELGLSRLVTGIGIGGIVASVPVLLTEVTPARRQGTVMALYSAGLAVGGVLGGVVARSFDDSPGWRATFLFGAAMTAVMFIVAFLVLPEPVESLLARRPAHALDRINALLPRMGLAPLPALPEPVAATRPRIGSAILFGRRGIRTVLLWLAFAASFAGYYFAASWTPNLVERASGATAQGINAGVALSVGGILGLLALSLLAFYAAIPVLNLVAFIGAGASLLLMALVLGTGGGSSGAVLAGAVAIGVFANSAVAALFALAPGLYPAGVRSTAVGWATAAGRIGGIVSPLVAGLLIDLGWSPAALFAVFSLTMVAGALAVLAISRFV